MKEFTPDISQLKKIHKAYKSWKKADTETLLRNNNSMRRVQATAKTMAEAGGKEAIITRLIYAEFNSKQVDYYWDMKSKDKKALEEGYEGLGFEDFKMSVMESVLNDSKVHIREAFGITYEQTKPEDFDHSELDKSDYTTEKSIHGKTHRLIFKVIPEHLRTGTTTRGSTFITDMASPIKVKVASKKVWKHADGSTYKDESHFTGKAQDITKIWSYIKSNGKPLEPGKTGEFNSEGRRESIKLDGVVYSKSGDDSDTISYTSPNRTSARWNR